MRGRWFRRVSVAVVLVGAALPASAPAAFPGQNGKIAFETSRDGGDSDIYVMNADGSGQTPLTANSARDISPAWSAAGTKIAFSSNRDNANYDVYVMNADGSGQTRLTTATGGDPAWSPDGTKIAFVRSGDIWVMNADGTNQAALITSPSTDWSPAWSPDGSKIAFERYLFACCPGVQIFVASAADGSGQTSLTPSDPDDSGFIGDNIDPNWSPSGGLIAFAHDACEGSCDPKPTFATYYVSPSDPGHYSGGSGGGREPAWSPDGTRIAFTLCHFTLFAECDGVDVGVMSFPGGEASGLTDDRRSASPDWQALPTPYARPKGATPLRVTLVPAYPLCTFPNRTHGPPLAFGSCNPTAHESSSITVGTPDANGALSNMEGYLRYDTILGDPTTPADEADLALRVQITDVRCRAGTAACGSANTADGPDYAGEVEAQTQTRMTDHEGAITATAADVRFPVTTQCSPTASLSIGSTCSLTTTLDTLIPGAVVEHARTILQLSQVQIVDGGADGDTATEPNTAFLRQGIFVP